MSVDFQNVTGNELEIKEIRPNPFKNDFTVDFNSGEETKCEFELRDENGKIVASDKFTTYSGFNNYHFRPDKTLSKGVYLATLIKNNIPTKTYKVVKH